MQLIKTFVVKWYPVILAFVCLLYSVGLGLLGRTDEAIYTAHWPGTILLFALTIRQRRR
ncbi:MAG: hypothetical protein ACJ0PS_04210 [Flavobacteriaceae bacterium]|jgi:hypothetical protein|tara:strand:+ start:211 stop:387 length:177 start_codon:yes stop_codon:yes gene_type:complete